MKSPGCAGFRPWPRPCPRFIGSPVLEGHQGMSLGRRDATYGVDKPRKTTNWEFPNRWFSNAVRSADNCDFSQPRSDQQFSQRSGLIEVFEVGIGHAESLN